MTFEAARNYHRWEGHSVDSVERPGQRSSLSEEAHRFGNGIPPGLEPGVFQPRLFLSLRTTRLPPLTRAAASVAGIGRAKEMHPVTPAAVRSVR
jgi:hypothetical protein